MIKAGHDRGLRRTLMKAGILCLSVGLSGCMSAEEQRRADLYRDSDTCTDYGAGYGSRGHTGCMLRQQERRDNEQLINMEKARISAETARNNLETLRLIRERRQQ